MALVADIDERERNRLNRTYEGRVVWHGAAFVMEALLLLFFLIVSLTIFMTLFSNATEMGEDNDRLASAVTLATNMAEQFTADPATSEGTYQSGDYIVTCQVTPDAMAGGTLYKAAIAVHRDDAVIYTLEVDSYKSGGGA